MIIDIGKLFLMLKTAFFSIWLIFHPVHVSVTSIEYAPEKSMFTAYVKLYFDDFLLDYKLSGGDTERVNFNVIDKVVLNETEKYLNKRFSIIVNNDVLKGKLKDLKIEENEMSMNLELPGTEKPDEVTVSCTFMTGLYADQSNMVIIKVKEFEEGFKLTPEKTQQTYKLK